MSDDAEYWAERAAEEHLKMAREAREQAERIQVCRDHWIEEGRPKGSTMYLHRDYENDDGVAAIEACERAAAHHEKRASEVYDETMERIRIQQEAEEKENKRLEGQRKADEILDEWFKE
jgi:hypothetical protein